MNYFMEKIRFYIAILVSNLLKFALRTFTKSDATSLPGMCALKICPNFLQLTQKYCDEEIINISGTNGKTTTAGLFAHILSLSGKTILHNEKGANMLTGIASALLSGIGFGRKNNYYVLESDEAYLTKLYDSVKANRLLVTNLFRDQLDRYGELDTTFKMLQSAVDKNKELKLLLNADDPMVALLGNKNDKKYYGFNNIKFMFDTVDANAPAEAVACSACSGSLSYTKRFYAHLGVYRCSCGYSRPELYYAADAMIFLDYSILNIKYLDKELNFRVNLPGLYNVYNALAAISMAIELGVSPTMIQSGLDTYQSVFGRAETTVLKGKKALIQLIKNPVGASEVLRLIGDNKSSKLLIMLNDNYADGRDVSWIWDANFEILKNYHQSIVVSGDRAYDMAVRLKYAGVDEKQLIIDENIENALNKAIELTQKEETLLILPTYTALLKMQNITKKYK